MKEKYKLVVSVNDRTFEKMVNEALDAGWMILGETKVTYNGDDVVFAQALVKELYEPVKDDWYNEK